MADIIYDKETLWKTGWKPRINTIVLYAMDGIDPVEVDRKPCSMTYAGGKFSLTTPIEFDVSGPTDNISYVELSNYTSFPDITFAIYKKDLKNIYDFLTEGKLIIDSLDLTLSGTGLTNIGKQYLFENGWKNTISKVTLQKLSTIIDTKEINFDVPSGKETFEMTGGVLTMTIPASTTGLTAVHLRDSSDYAIFEKILPGGPFSSTVESDFRILSWEFVI